jgi:N utilization substance protein A
MATAISANKAELLAIANSVASEKMIDKAIVIEAIEEAIQRAARARYGAENDIRAKLDPQTGDLRLWRVVEVVESVEDYFKQVDLAQGQKLQKDAKIGDFIVDPLPAVDLGRIDAQSAKQVIFQKVREADRQRQYEEFKDRAGEIITGVVKSVEFGHIVVNLGRAEGVIRRDQQIPRELMRVGDRVRALILSVRSETRGPQIFLSRAHPDFMKKLFAQEVPEIYDGIIEIKGVAREAGSRAKITVLSKDPGIDPVGACVGMRGSRVQAVVGELQGEKVEIIPYTEDPASFVVNALAPAEVAKVVMDEVASRMEVVVPDDQLSLAIGRRGQNVRLASQLSGWYIDILTEAEESERRQEEFRTRSARFIEALNIDDVIAHLLVAEGFVLPEEIAETPIEELSTIQGFDESIADELQTRAVEFVERESQRINEALDALKVADDLRNFEYISLGMMLKLAENGVVTLDDLADLDSDELVALLSEHGLEDDTEAGDIIMAARAHWFDDEDAEAAEMPAGDAEAEAGSGDAPAAS